MQWQVVLLQRQVQQQRLLVVRLHQPLTSEQNAATHAATAQTSITTAQQFLDTYFVGSSAPSGSNLTIGDLWFDTANNLMKVYGSGGFQAAGSSVNGTAERQDYTVGTSSGSYTGSTTVFPANYMTLLS